MLFLRHTVFHSHIRCRSCNFPSRVIRKHNSRFIMPQSFCNIKADKYNSHSIIFTNRRKQWEQQVKQQFAINLKETLCILLKKEWHFVKSQTLEATFRQFTWKGYECTKILIAIFLTGFSGVKMYRAEVALNRKIAFPLFNTINVWKRKQERN